MRARILALGTAAAALAFPAAGAGTGPATSPAAAARRAPLVVVDPGHDARPNLATEPVGPGSATTKVKDGGGTHGVVTGTPEAVVALDVSLRLARLLRAAGVRVTLTRRRTAGVSMGNVARAQVANRAHAALFVRVHADGSPDPAAHGTSTLYPARRRGWTDDIAGPSRRAAALLQAEVVRALGSRDRGLVARSDITGFNWADVPAVLPELGFMTNPAEDRRFARASYRQRAAVGLCRGTLRFLGRAPGGCGRA